MKTCKALAYFFLIILLAAGCYKTPKEVEKVIRKAGTNRKQLQKVIDHYKETGEKQKLKAAWFLIGNMDNKYSAFGSNLNDYYAILKEVDTIKRQSGIPRDSLDKIVNIKMQQLEVKKGKPDMSDIRQAPDIQIITAEYLIQNIDQAFSVWQKPWARHVSFDDFCEYILPYRIHNEPLSNWREYFYNQLITLSDSLKDPSDPKELLQKVSEYLYKRWNHFDNYSSYGFYPDLIEMLKCNGGQCEHRYYLFTGMCRSLGLPVSIDFTPQWANYTGGHSWNVFVDTDGRIRPVNGGEDNFRYFDKNLIPTGDGSQLVTKVYRRTFEYQKDALPFVTNNRLSVPEIFNDKNLTDVTWNYDIPKSKYKLYLKGKNLNGKIVYLTVFNYGTELNYVAWAKVKHNRAEFDYLGLPVIYLPGISGNKGFELVHSPLVLPKDKDYWKDYKPDLQNKITVRLVRKFNYSGDFMKFADGMIGGRFQGAGKTDFSDAVNLYTITQRAKAWEEAVISAQRKFRYVRYLSNDSLEVRIAEIEFLSRDIDGITKKPEGKVIGYAPGTDSDNDALFRNALDGDVQTNFNAKAGSWVGFDLGQNNETQISGIAYLPRNNFNIIVTGDSYELLYLTDQWVSLGKQVADKHYLVYDGVPSNAILLLKNLTEGRQERIFMYDAEKNEQVWW